MGTLRLNCLNLLDNTLLEKEKAEIPDGNLRRKKLNWSSNLANFVFFHRYSSFFSSDKVTPTPNIGSNMKVFDVSTVPT